MTFKKKHMVVPILILVGNILFVCLAKRPPEAAKQVRMTPRPTKVEKQRDGADIMIDHAYQQSLDILLDN